MADLAIAWTEVDSSNVKALAHDAATKTLGVEFHNGTFYSYSDVPVEIFVEMVHAESVGKYLNRVIKAAHTYERHLSREGLEVHMLHHHE